MRLYPDSHEGLILSTGYKVSAAADLRSPTLLPVTPHQLLCK